MVFNFQQSNEFNSEEGLNLKKNTQFKVTVARSLCAEATSHAGAEKKAPKLVGWTELDERSVLISEKEEWSIHWLGIACISP
jgi:hypothetical protein